MNFSRWQTFRHVVLPQAWKVILPPAFAFVVIFIKDTSLASQIGVVELTFAGKVLNNRGFSATLVFGTVLLLYFALSYPLSRLGGWLENRLASPRSQRPEQRLRSLPVLQDVSLTVAKGEVVSLIGPSGSGKSTLLRVLMGLTPPTGGEVLIDGEPIDYATRTSVRARATAWPSCSSSTTCSRT